MLKQTVRQNMLRGVRKEYYIGQFKVRLVRQNLLWGSEGEMGILFRMTVLGKVSIGFRFCTADCSINPYGRLIEEVLLFLLFLNKII